MANTLQLLVGLGNPGNEYALTRHNAGAWLVTQFADQNQVSLRLENKFSGLFGSAQSATPTLRLLIPTTYMNHSGQAVQAVCAFYRIPVEAVLVAHDDLDLPPGTARIKQGGGDGGHNGLKDISQKLGNNYWRLRLGIGHPGNRNQVHDYVLSRPTKSEQQQIKTAIESALNVIPLLLADETQQAMQALHTLS